MTTLRQYETTYILAPDLDEADRKKAIERINEVLSGQGGDVARQDEWGKRKLAYPIRKHARGYYVYTRYAAPGEAVAELERNLRLMEPVIKFLTIKVDSDREAAAQAALVKRSEKEGYTVTGLPEVERYSQDDEGSARRPAADREAASATPAAATEAAPAKEAAAKPAAAEEAAPAAAAGGTMVMSPVVVDKDSDS